VKYLLDVNALVAALWATHEHHARVHRWLAARTPADAVLSCALTEIGFIRVINAAYDVPMDEAKAALAEFRRKAGLIFLEAAPSPLEALPAWTRSHKQVMDAYLIALAAHHGAALSTLDRGIPGAKLMG
jgi:toxin-antitoxin system PIN domain toxin